MQRTMQHGARIAALMASAWLYHISVRADEVIGLLVVENFDVAPATTTPAKAAPAKAADTPAGDKAKAEGLGQRGEREVTVGDELSFREEQVLGEMSELEQRMFRLSEALKKLEPENSSRLLIGLKYAREELVLPQMKEIQAALARLNLKGAATDQQQLLAKLARLQQLLLSNDLDFEMRLERLRAIRATLRKLDTVIKEESREEKLSKQSAAREKELAALAKRREALEKLIKEQQEHVDKNTPLAKQESLSDSQRGDVGKLAEGQKATQKSTQSLADELQDGAKSKKLLEATAQMQSAAAALDKTQPSEAQPPLEKALESLKSELADVSQAEADAKKSLEKDKFAAMKKDQEGNRAATEEVTEMTRALGNNGANALPELLQASTNMAGAESAFGNSAAGQGNSEQGKALAALKYAEEQLAEEAERLARQLRREVKKRVSDGLTAMLEMQISVRERTVALGPGVKQGSRQALAALTAVAKREEKITDTADELINIVEETEFGIALPAALAAVRDATEAVQVALAEGDASNDVVKAEKQIEADLKDMLEVVSEMSDANSRKGKRMPGGSADEQRREQNRIISELKMIKLLEIRVQQSTKEVDAKRGEASLAANVRKRIEHLEGRQEDIRDATELLAAERGDDIPEPQ